MDYILSRKLIEKANSVPFTSFEDPNFYNHYSRVNGRIGQRFLSPVVSVLETIQCIIQVFSFTFFLLNVNWLVIML